MFGFSDSSTSGDKTENSRGEEDYWMVSITSTLNASEISGVNMKLYPNPTSDEMYLNFGAIQDEGRLEIIGIDGMVMYSIQLKSAYEHVVDVSSFSSGIYYVCFTNSKYERIMDKLIIK